MVRAALTLGGADVRTASSASDAIRAWEHDPSDALLCDLAMPDMDGFQLLNRIAVRCRGGRVTAAVALTAYTSDEQRIRCLSAGFQAHVGKPYKLDDLSIARCGAGTGSLPAGLRPTRRARSTQAMSHRIRTARPCWNAPRRRRAPRARAACLALFLCVPLLVGAEEGQTIRSSS